MLPLLQDISALRLAVEVCFCTEVKKEILCASGSDYDRSKKSYHYDRKQHWNEIVETKGSTILGNLGLPVKLQKKVMGIALPIGMRMLTWAVYHEGTVGFSREYSINFLNRSFLTEQGILDNKKAAGELMKDERFNIRQKYALACLYCFKEHIYTCYLQMVEEDKMKFHNDHTGLIKFWSYYLKGDIDVLQGNHSTSRYRLKKAVESGSKSAVEYCLNQEYYFEQGASVYAAVKAVVNRIRRRNDWIDWFVFQDRKYYDIQDPWVPSDYFVDILFFLLSRMTEDKQIEFLKKDIEGVAYKEELFEARRRSRVLEYFLNWPYQDHFMKTAELMWEFLPKDSYAVLLLKICDKIDPRKKENIKYGEEKSYDYRGLFREFWKESPEPYKRFVLSNQEISYRLTRVKTCIALLIKLLYLRECTFKDKRNIQLVLASASDKEKENIIACKEGGNICTGLIKDEKWEILDMFVLNCFPCTEQADMFKGKLSFTKGAQLICISFIISDRWDAAESFINWSSLPEVEINRLKREMIYSKDGLNACVDLISYDKRVEMAEKFIRWSFPSEEEEKEFKKQLIFSVEGIRKCAQLVTENQLGLVDDFINFGLFSETDIQKFKRSVAYGIGYSFCRNLISNFTENKSYHSRSRTIKFEGGKWEEAEKFLTWCFESEEEISEFKRNEILKKSGAEIHLNFIQSNKWGEAETFFAWLGLSAEEIKELKKEALFHHNETILFFLDLMFSEEDTTFVDYGSKEEAIELFLRWYLTDKETVLEFKDEFKSWFYGEVTESRRVVFQMFEMFEFAIEQRLNDLDEEQRKYEDSVIHGGKFATKI